MKKKLIVIISTLILVIGCVIAALVTKPYAYKPITYLFNHIPIKTSDNGNDMVVMSYNLRGCFSEDQYEKSWTNRAPYIRKNIEYVNPDIIGFQEYDKYANLFMKIILSDYVKVDTSIDDIQDSKGNQIYFKKDRYSLVNKGSFWLSETPEEYSKGWGAMCYRTCGYVILNDKNTNKELVVFNTHLDHISSQARIEGIKLIVNKIEELGFKDKSSLIMGDMNDYEGSSTINTLFDNFNDSCANADDYSLEEKNKSTYQGWGKYLNNNRIDFIGVSDQIHVLSYKVLDKTYSDNVYSTIYPSDHFPVYIKININ